MPTAPGTACSEPLCPRTSVARGRCALHQRSEEERGYGRVHRQQRGMKAGATCAACGCRENLQLDHIVPRSLGGTDAPSNKRWLCRCPEHRCHDRIGVRADRLGGRVADRSVFAPQNTRAHELRTWQFDLEKDSHGNGPVSARFAHIVGKPGSGKSHLARQLATDLGLPHLDIADQPGHLTNPAQAWASLRSRMTGPAIVESAGTSGWEARFWRGIDRLPVICAAPDEIRIERLQARPEARTEPGYVRRMLVIPTPPLAGLPWSGTAAIPGPAYDSLLDSVRRYVIPAEAFIGA